MFKWFSRKSAAQPVAENPISDFGPADATEPYHPHGGGKASNAAALGGAAHRKGERMGRRELLYTVVRDTMTGAGILSSGYKFKVLSLDSHGVQYLIMMDLARQYVGETGQLAEIENLIAQQAKARFGILVTAVYWRVNESVTVRALQPVVATPPHPPAAPVGTAPEVGAAAGTPSSLRDEVEAFKQARAADPQAKLLSAPGEIIRSRRRNVDEQPGFENTTIEEPRAAPLSATQYGDLN
ncbi:MAG: hypothetical protein ACR2I0_12175 [Rhodoferax sp.]